MAHAVKEEELADNECLDKHDKGSRQHGEKADDVANTNAVEDDVAWTCQGALEERHACE